MDRVGFVRTRCPCLFRCHRRASPDFDVSRTYSQAVTAVTAGLVSIRVQELCESRGGGPGFSVRVSLTVSVDVKQH